MSPVYQFHTFDMTLLKVVYSCVTFADPNPSCRHMCLWRRGYTLYWGFSHKSTFSSIFLAYDNMCQLDAYRPTKQPLSLPPPYDTMFISINKIIDEFHLKNHVQKNAIHSMTLKNMTKCIPILLKTRLLRSKHFYGFAGTAKLLMQWTRFTICFTCTALFIPETSTPKPATKVEEILFCLVLAITKQLIELNYFVFCVTVCVKLLNCFGVIG